MLVLTRKRGQVIVIDEDIFITVLEIKGDRVRLGIVAPAEVSIRREEVHARFTAPEKPPPDPFLPED
jgi:carbon storage regulator